ncbi:MAG: NAD(P)H-binding protein [Bacteroidia bacterium]|nr:NAD(P)H-binding protein [Bacteroidia bacterium]
MKLVVFGASGKTGLIVVEQALAAGHSVVAYIRTPGRIIIENPNLKVVVGSLQELDKLKSALSGADACISTLGGGSLTKHNLEVMEGIDSIVRIMETESVPRFIYMSSVGAGESRYYIPQPFRFLMVDVMLRIPIADHNVNEERISKSTLQWTAVRPGGLTDGPVTGNLKYGSEKIKLTGNAGISRSNVAAFMVSQLSDTSYVNAFVWLHE